MLWLKRLQLFLNRASVQHGLQGLLLKVVTVRLLAAFNWIDIQLHTCLLFASLPLAVALWLQRAGSNRKSGLAMIKCSLCRKVVLVDQCATCSAAVGPKCQRTHLIWWYPMEQSHIDFDGKPPQLYGENTRSGAMRNAIQCAYAPNASKCWILWQLSVPISDFDSCGLFTRLQPRSCKSKTPRVHCKAGLLLLIVINIYIYILWRFPKIGVPPVLIHFLLGFSIINHPPIGVPPFMEIPICWNTITAAYGALPSVHPRAGCLTELRNVSTFNSQQQPTGNQSKKLACWRTLGIAVLRGPAHAAGWYDTLCGWCFDNLHL